MRGLFPRDPLLVGRLGAFLGAVAWLWLGGQGVVPLAAVALTFLVVTSAGVWWLDRKRGHALALHEVPAQIVLADLGTAGVWMVGSATNPRSIAFVIVLAVGAFAMYRLGRGGLIATMTTYLAARLGMEAIRVALGEPTPVPQLVAEVIVVSLAVLIVSATVDSYRAEQTRAENALRRGNNLERLAAEIASETEPMALFHTIARSALLLANAHHATINVRRGEEFYIAAGAGTGERVVGVHAPAEMGIVGAVLRTRATVAVNDYATDPTAVPAVRDIGVRALICVPIFLHGEFAATITVGRLDTRPFDAEDRAALELVLMRDYASDSAIEPDRPISMLAREVGIHATMVAPVIFDGEIRAALTVGTTDPYRSFDAIERRELRAFADLASTALRAANERRERERRIGRLSALNVLAWQLGAVHDRFEIARLAFDAAGTLVSRDSFSIARYDERGNELEFVINARGDEGGVDEERVRVGSGPASLVIQSGEPFRAPSEVYLPMKSRGKLVGVLACGADAPKTLDDEDVAVLQTLANLVATAFENAEALARMRELYLASVPALAAAVDARDPSTPSHRARA